MMIKTPKFWLKKNLIAWLLWPLSLIYRILFFCSHNFKKRQSANLPIICVGNVIAGGSGKTPTALAIGKILQEISLNYAFLTRGHRGKEQKIRQVNPDICNFVDVGDEALILAAQAPTFMAKNRLEGIEFIEKRPDFKAIILDDGMQNATLQKDFLAMVIDGKIKFGNGLQIPAGPLRQSVVSGLKMADLIVVIGEIDDELAKILASKKDRVTSAKIVAKNLQNFHNRELLAFCGLAYPEKFFDYLKKSGLKIAQKKSFPDHYPYQESDLRKLLEGAKAKGLKLVTTKKDWVKFSEKFKAEIEFLDIELEFEKKEMVVQKIADCLKGNG